MKNKRQKCEGSTEGLQEKTISYFVSRYPSLTMTFIDREIQEVRRRGIKLILVAISQPNQGDVAAGVKNNAEGTKYIRPYSWRNVLSTNVYFLITQFSVYVSTLYYLLTGHHDSLRDRVKTLFHFVGGVTATAMLRCEGVDHIHAHFADGVATMAIVASRLLRVPYSLTAHAFDIYKEPVLLLEKLVEARFVTTCTRYNKAYLEGRIDRDIELIYHGLDLEKINIHHCRGSKSRCPLILSVGTLVERKGHVYLIKACGLLRDEGYDFLCEIIGQGPMENELRGLIADLKLEQSVKLVGALLNAQVMTKYAQASVVVQASVVAEDSDRDGIPNVILEAMAVGTAVVATDVSGIPEVIEDGINGVLIDARNDKALATAIARVLDDDRLSDALAEKARRLVEHKFDIRKNTDRLVELFRTET